jgi:hypothetical protein
MEQEYKNDEKVNWYGFTIRRFNSLLRYPSPLSPSNYLSFLNFLDFCKPYILKAAKKAEEKENVKDFPEGFSNYIDKMLEKMKTNILKNNHNNKILLMLFMLALFSPKFFAVYNLGTKKECIMLSKKLLGLGI